LESKRNNNEKKLSGRNVNVPFGLTATTGDLDGEVDLVWEPVRGANAYIIQVSRHAGKPSSWIQEDVVTRSSHTISKLKSGTTYSFRIAAAGSKGQSTWSEPVSKKAP
jgi:hypothetical protein